MPFIGNLIYWGSMVHVRGRQRTRFTFANTHRSPSISTIQTLCVCESFELMIKVIYNTARQKERTKTRTERDIFPGKPPSVLDSEELICRSGVIRLQCYKGEICSGLQYKYWNLWACHGISAMMRLMGRYLIDLCYLAGNFSNL
jgi:hypothetical protein